MNIKFATALFISLLFACTSKDNSKFDTNSIPAALIKLEELQKSKIDFSAVSFRASDSIQIPSDVKYPKLKKLVDAYLDVNDMQIIVREEKSIVSSKQPYRNMWSSDMKAAEDLAKTENKPILVKFTTNYCGACEEQDQMFFGQEKVFNLLKNFVLVEIKDDQLDENAINGIDTPNVLLAKKLDIVKGMAYPTIVMIGKSGNEIMRGHADKWDEYWAKFLNFQKSH